MQVRVLMNECGRRQMISSLNVECLPLLPYTRGSCMYSETLRSLVPASALQLLCEALSIACK